MVLEQEVVVLEPTTPPMGEGDLVVLTVIEEPPAFNFPPFRSKPGELADRLIEDISGEGSESFPVIYEQSIPPFVPKLFWFRATRIVEAFVNEQGLAVASVEFEVRPIEENEGLQRLHKINRASTIHVVGGLVAVLVGLVIGSYALTKIERTASELNKSGGQAAATFNNAVAGVVFVAFVIGLVILGRKG